MTPDKTAVSCQRSVYTKFCTPSSAETTIPFSKVLKSPILWQMALIWFLFDITFWGFSSWLPSYLMKVRGFSLAKTGIMAAIPFLCGTVGTLLGG